MDKKLLGKRINTARKERGWTSERLSEACNINATYLRQIEAGTKVPSLQVFVLLCEARGWSEYQLAERSGLPQSTISSWYKKDMTPSFASLEKICDAFGITLSQFFADGEESVVLTPSQRKMLDKWNCLTEAQHNSLLILMDSM